MKTGRKLGKYFKKRETKKGILTKRVSGLCFEGRETLFFYDFLAMKDCERCYERFESDFER